MAYITAPYTYLSTRIFSDVKSILIISFNLTSYILYREQQILQRSILVLGLKKIIIISSKMRKNLFDFMMRFCHTHPPM